MDVLWSSTSSTSNVGQISKPVRQRVLHCCAIRAWQTGEMCLIIMECNHSRAPAAALKFIVNLLPALAHAPKGWFLVLTEDKADPEEDTFWGDGTPLSADFGSRTSSHTGPC